MTYTTVWCVTVISKSVLMHIAASVLPRLAVAIDQGSNECRRAENPKPKNSLHDADMRILFESFLGILLFDPAFPSTILLHKFLQVFDTLKIPVYCFGTQDPLKKVLCLIVSQALFVLLSHFHMNLKILDMQNVWPNWLSTCCWQFSTGNHQYVMFCRRKILMMQRCTAKIMQRASSGSRKSL